MRFAERVVRALPSDSRPQPWPDPVHGRLALFDLDRTLLPGASASALVRALVAEGIVSRRLAVRAGLEHLAYKHRGSTDAQVERVRARALACLAGMERAPLAAVADRVADELVASMSPGAHLLLRRHLDGGDFCVLLSASPHDLVDRIGTRLGVQRAIGTRAELDGDRFTGALAGPLCYGAGKLDALRAAAGEVDLLDAWAYADSASDLPVLRACGHPVAVNPDRALRRVALAQRWPILTVG